MLIQTRIEAQGRAGMPWSRESTWDTEVGMVRGWGKELGAGKEPGAKQWWEVMEFPAELRWCQRH